MRLAKDTDRPFQHLRALWLIGREGLETQVELADRLTIDAPAASRLVDRLEAAGLVARRAGRDRRTFRLVLTRKAAGDIAMFDRALDALDAELHQHLGAKDRETLRRVLDRVNQTFVVSCRRTE